MSYQLLLTNAGATKIATASNAGGTPLHITDFAVGQGVNVDFSTRLDKQTLVAKRYQGKVESVNLVAPNKYEIVCVVPVDVGGFTIREFGLIDSDGVLVWVGSLPEVQKPTADSLSAVDYRLKAVVQIDNPAVSIVVDTNAVTATQSWVNANFAAIGHNHQDMLDRLTALENRIYEAIAVGGIYATAKLYANGQDVHAELGYGVWALYAQSKILAGFSTIATDDNKFKTIGNVFEIGSEIENQKAIVAQFWKRLPNDYIAPTFDMYYTSDEAGLNRVTVIGEETPIYLWLNVANATQPIQIISFLSDASGTIHLTNSNISHPNTVNNGKTLLVSIPQDNYSVDNPVTLNWGFVLNDPTVDVETAINAPLAINNTVSDAPPVEEIPGRYVIDVFKTGEGPLSVDGNPHGDYYEGRVVKNLDNLQYGRWANGMYGTAYRFRPLADNEVNFFPSWINNPETQVNIYVENAQGLVDVNGSPVTLPNMIVENDGTSNFGARMFSNLYYYYNIKLPINPNQRLYRIVLDYPAP